LKRSETIASGMPYSELRRGRRSIAGQTYVLTAVTRDRRRIFDRPSTIAIVARALLELERSAHWRLHGWVAMPDHVHVVATLGESELSETMRLFKGRSARAINAGREAPRTLWQPGFHDHALRSDESVRAAVLYVCANPLRAGLALSLREYGAWDAPEMREECMGMVAEAAGPTEVGPTAERPD
jgi:REP element-mobilizing transposase RayT